jgi:hypothetical protein
VLDRVRFSGARFFHDNAREEAPVFPEGALAAFVPLGFITLGPKEKTALEAFLDLL